ncbi:MAG: MotA/TolQ/ExbB proton channel family protein [Candidatus Omnitrophica bacterium]|nr:MotA/TolQ/ExbB proton channel family protein [Candidatus Omnitrophota bacterium]MCB9747886.1 MotA/TolQ/ExbB proton channel family protein [Candidatus Omnitrophota bacterium]
MFWDYELSALFAKAGLTRWPLLICSIFGLAIILERSIYFLKIRFNLSKFTQKLFEFLNKNQFNNALELTQKSIHPASLIAGIYLNNLQNKYRENVLSREGSLAMERVEQRLRGLAVITHVAPLLGLLGTVAGLVAAFHEIELLNGYVQPGNLAGGIWEALLSTVFGLIVAIPCMVAFHLFEAWADQVARYMQAVVSQLDEYFGNQATYPFKVSAPSIDIDEINAAQ